MNPEEIVFATEVGERLVQAASQALRDDLAGFFRAPAGSPISAVKELAEHLNVIKPNTPVSDMIRAALETKDDETIRAVGNYIKLPLQGRTLLNIDDIGDLTRLIGEGSEHSLTRARTTLNAVSELSADLPADKSGAEILQEVKRSGAAGFNSWLARDIHLR